jgi:hypothetical protein
MVNAWESVSPVYARAAREQGVFFEVEGGWWVAGKFEDPVSDLSMIYVEAIAPELARAKEELQHVLARASELGSPRSRISVRLPASLPRFEWLAPSVTTLYLENATGSVASGATEATPEADEQIARWLCDAFIAGYRIQGYEIGVDAAREGVSKILGDPSRVAYVWRDKAGKVGGHATVLRDQVDEVSGLCFDELVDVLVEDASCRRVATAALVARASTDAVARGRPLVGTVIHGGRSRPTPRTHAIVSQLELDGWRQAWTVWDVITLGHAPE